MDEEKFHLLILDDDNRILKLLKKFFRQSGFMVSTTSSAAEALKLMDYFIYDLIILDVMMPEITGLELTKKIKINNKTIPIIMLTALSEAENRIEGLEAGASDYIAKPFEPRELLLRINNLIYSYHTQQQARKMLRFGNNYYDPVSGELKQNNKNIRLSSTEQKLLNILIKSGATPISREYLSQQMGSLSLRSVDVQIVRLRSKIEPDAKNPQFLQTVRNQGYVFYI